MTVGRLRVLVRVNILDSGKASRRLVSLDIFLPGLHVPGSVRSLIRLFGRWLLLGDQSWVAGSIATNSFIKNRLSAIEFHHQASASAADEKFTFPVTALTFDYNNNTTYLTPEEISALNEPIGQFTGTRAVTGSATMYLRTGDLESAGFLRNISEDSRTSSAQTSNANLIIGGTTAPYVAFQLDATQFEFPQIATDDVISMSVNFVGQEPTASKGDGGEVKIFAKKT